MCSVQCGKQSSSSPFYRLRTHWEDFGETFRNDNILKLSEAPIVTIDVAPTTQVTHVRNKNSNIQGRSLNVIKVIFHTIK